MNTGFQSDKEKRVYADTLRRAAIQYEEVVSDLSVQRLFNDSLQVGMDFDEICHKLVQFLTKSTNVENASVMRMDHVQKELKLLVAKGFSEEEGTFSDDFSWPARVFKLGEGVAGLVAKTRTGILINDTDQDERFEQVEGQRVKIRSLLCLPLVHGDLLYGVLNLSNSKPEVFNAGKQHAVNILASTASVALSHSLISKELSLSNKELKIRNKELAAVIALSESLHADLDPDAVLARSLENILEGFDVEIAAVYLENIKTGAMELKTYKTGIANLDAEPLLQSLSPQFIQEVIKSRSTLVELHPFEKAKTKEAYPLAPGICIGMPLFSGKDCLGLLVTVSSKGQESKPARIRLLNSMCNQVSMAVQNSNLVSHLRENIKELQETKHKLLQSDKLALLGEMISGVAHEINNPMAAIMGYSELLLCEESLSGKNRKMVEKVLVSVGRSRKIMQGLLSFSRKTGLKKELVNIDEIIDRVIEHREYDFKVNNIKVAKDYEADAPMILADPNQIEQVILNIVNNAFDSMVAESTAGKLEIRTRTIEDSVMQIEFIDNGQGIGEDDKTKVFEPFFTTKEIGKGTGLGLSVSYGIIEEHGGHLSLDESYSDGAKLVIMLPITHTYQRVKPSRVEEKVYKTPKAEGRILVVDDEETITDFMRAALSSRGFAVDCISDAEKAYEMVMSTPYDLVITDIRMPGAMDGRDFFNLLKSDKPQLAERFMFISGDIMEEETANFLKESGKKFLVKPFSLKDLHQTVDTILMESSH